MPFALAVPYLLPFAEAAGIVIAGLGLYEISQRVQDHMEANPEDSLKILTMIMPAEGLMALFNKEAGDEGEGEDETKLSGKEKEKEMSAEAQETKGSYQEKEGKATGSYGSKRGRMIRRAEELGLADPDLKDKPYDKSKKYQGWKRFVRKKADGGRIGFVEGGWADDLTGQGLALYNSMTAGGHSTQTIQDTLTELGYWGGDASAGTGVQSIVNTQPTLGGGGDGNINAYNFSTPKFNQQGLPALKEYGPGGTYEMSPEALGMSFFDQTGSGSVPKEKNFLEKTFDAFTSVPNKMSSQFEIRPGVIPKGPQELGFMTRDIEGFPGVNRDQIRAMYDNYSPFWGRTSNYPNARVKGSAANLAGMIPYAGTLSKMFGGPRGVTSDRERWAVDNAGYGQGTQRDQFGTFTGGKTLFGKTADYQERMEDKIAGVAKNYGYSLNDLMSLDEDALTDLASRNNFYATMVKDYVQKIGITKQNKILKEQKIEDKKKKDDLAKITAKDYKPGDATINWDPNIKTTGPTYGPHTPQTTSFNPGQGGNYQGGNYGADPGTPGGWDPGARKDGGLATMFQRR